jgi:hypothetical protein
MQPRSGCDWLALDVSRALWRSAPSQPHSRLMPSVDQAQLFRSQDTRASFPSPPDMIALILAVLPLVAAVATDSTIDQNPEDKQGWYSAPNYRGTLDIVWPCLLTVFLCCWNAIHPDIPHPKSTWLQRFLDRTMCLFLGAAAPEMFVYFAYREKLWAKSEYEEAVAILGQENWSIAHGFYSQMGGFAVELDAENDSGRIIRYADTDSICRFFQEGRISPNNWITKEDIEDKAKVDGLVKGLTILQLLWLLVQCSARLAQHLPLTTLELSTLAYVPCAIFMYYLWWDKPYEINIPTYLSLDPEGTYIRDNMSSSHTQLDLRRGITGPSESNESDEPKSDNSSRNKPTFLDSKASYKKSMSDSWEIHARSHASQAFPGRLPGHQVYCMTRQCLSSLDYFETYSHAYVTSAVFFLVGAIHLSAWNISFATTYERTAWRICSIFITVSMPLVWLINRMLEWRPSFQAWKLSKSIHEDSADTSTKPAIERLIHGLWYVFAVPYVIARLYLLVEVFVALRAAPKDVYRTPEWTNFVPHFG